uniref:Retrotransposon gag domain-containing protein n=1 Tax=Nicotiana tabacum TaxID=4097 RepID=A0A1S4D2J7_TOBAC
PISDTPESYSKDSLIQNLAAELKRLTNRVQGVEDSKDVELPEGYKPPKFKMFDGTGDHKVYLRMYYDKLVGVERDEKIRMKLFMRSLKGDALSWYISQDAKKWTSWVIMASNFMDRFRFNTENLPDDQQYYERLMLIEGQKFSNIIKLGERIEEGIKNGMVTNLEALQATNKALQSGGTSKEKDVNSMIAAQRNNSSMKQYTAIAEPIDQLYEKLKAADYVTPIPAVTPENPSQWINPNKTCTYHSGMKGHTIDECRSLKNKIQNLTDNKIIIAKEPAPNVRNNPLPDHKGRSIHMIDIEDDWDPKGSIRLIAEGDEPQKSAVALNPIVVQIQPSKEDVVNVSVPLEFEAPPAKVPKPIEDYTAEARRKGKTHTREAVAAQGMTRTGRVYTPEHLAESSKQASGRPVKTGPDDLWRKIQANEYSVVEQLNKTPAQISILALLQSSETHKNALMKILSEAYVPSNITGGEMANMVGQ